jgi:hypothetical protein
MTTEEELKDLAKRVTSLEVYFKVALGIAAVFGLSGAVIFALLTGARNQIVALEAQVNNIRPVVEASIEQIQDAGEAEVGKLTTKTDAYLQSSVDARFKALGKSREGTALDVTNPRQGSLKASCPPGAFVSAVSAPLGVGGSYGVDGISKLTVVCSAIETDGT